MIQLENKLCIVTGANAGIGKEAAIQIAASGATVVMACRSRQRAGPALEEIKKKSGSNEVRLMIVDMSCQASIHSFCETFRSQYDSLDVLIHNAADFDISRKEAILSPEGIETVWATNHLGPFLMTQLLWDSLKAGGGGRVITVASKGLIVHPRLKIDYEDIEFKERRYSTQRAYYQSKLAQVMFTYQLAEKGKAHGISAHCVRVTNVRIDVDRYPGISAVSKFMYKLKSAFSISPAAMAGTYTWLAGATELSDKTGLYWDAVDTPVRSSAYANDKAEQIKLWKISEEMIR